LEHIYRDKQVVSKGIRHFRN